MFHVQVNRDIILHLLETQHASQIYELLQRERPYLHHWLAWAGDTTTMAEIWAFVYQSMQDYEANTSINAGIWFQRQFVGGIGLNVIDWANASTELGYWISEPYQQRGIVTQSCRALIRYAFDDMNLHRLVIRCAVGNARSQAIPQRLGFTYEGVQRHGQWLHTRFVDIAVYSLLKGELPPAPPATATPG